MSFLKQKKQKVLQNENESIWYDMFKGLNRWVMKV